MMSVMTRKQKRQKDEAIAFKRPLIVSCVLHVLIFLIATFGIPYFWNSPPEPPQEIIMTVDFVDVSEDAATPVRDKPVDQDHADKPKRKPKPTYNSSSSVPDLLTPQEPDLSDVPMPDAEKPDEPAIKKPPKPKNKPKRKLKPTPQKTEEKPKEEPKDEEVQIDSLLRSVLNEDTDDTPPVETEDSGEAAQSQIAPVSQQLLSSMETGLNSGMRKCWNVNAGGKYAEQQIVKLEVFVNRDRTVQSVKFVEFLKYNSDPHYKAAADAARWALLNRNCWPLNLPEDKYDLWKRFIYTFDPSSML